MQELLKQRESCLEDLNCAAPHQRGTEWEADRLEELASLDKAIEREKSRNQ